MKDGTANRIKSLDSLRGIAALVVVLQHSLSTLPEWKDHIGFLGASLLGKALFLIKVSPLRIFVVAPSAVLVFFALSGLVLAASIDWGGQFSYRTFLVRRVSRIYVPFLVAIGIASLLYMAAQPTTLAIASHWFNETFWTASPTPGVLLGHLAMVGTPEFQQLDQPMWSLVHELRISIVFPVLFFVASRRPVLGIAGLFCLSLLTTALPASGFARSALNTLSYLYLFCAGAALFAHRDWLRARITAMPLYGRLGLWLACIGMISAPMQLRGAENIAGVGAIILVGMCWFDERAAQVLVVSPAQWLGRISYSLYLIHIPIILFVVHTFAGRLGIVPSVACAFMLAFPAAHLMHRFVEVPAARLGRRLTSDAVKGNTEAPAKKRAA